MISIIDYGLGNLASVKKALDFLGFQNQITGNHEFIKNSDTIILPGVGSFNQGMYNLINHGLDQLLTEEVLQKKKRFLGICLGMQLIFDCSEESIGTKGLGWIKGQVKKFNDSDLKIPHMGWNDTKSKNNYTIKNSDYYFIHSYHCVPEDYSIISSHVNYGIEVVSSIQLDNIYAMQFHPEKSQSAGLELLREILK